MKEDMNLIKRGIDSSYYFTQETSQLSLAKTFYKLANSFLDNKDLVKGLDCFCDTFILRNKDIESLEDDFLEFFKIQFIMYLLGKKKIKVALSEGDMIFDLIEDTFIELSKEMEESPFYIKDENKRSFYKTIEIDFPWMMFEDAFFA
ncbi:MAG: hypothetical protein ACPKM0_00220 [Pleomorphochaeta sp.]